MSTVDSAKANVQKAASPYAKMLDENKNGLEGAELRAITAKDITDTFSRLFVSGVKPETVKKIEKVLSLSADDLKDLKALKGAEASEQKAILESFGVVIPADAKESEIKALYDKMMAVLESASGAIEKLTPPAPTSADKLVKPIGELTIAVSNNEEDLIGGKALELNGMQVALSIKKPKLAGPQVILRVFDKEADEDFGIRSVYTFVMSPEQLEKLLNSGVEKGEAFDLLVNNNNESDSVFTSLTSSFGISNTLRRTASPNFFIIGVPKGEKFFELDSDQVSRIAIENGSRVEKKQEPVSIAAHTTNMSDGGTRLLERIAKAGVLETMTKDIKQVIDSTAGRGNRLGFASTEDLDSGYRTAIQGN